MKRSAYLVSVFFFLAVGCSEINPQHPDDEDQSVVIYGKVTYDGLGVGGVAVSDGFEIVRTDDAGNYSIVSENRCGYVFITLPSGYTCSERNGVLPDLCKAVTASNGECKVDFSLRQMAGDSFRMIVAADLHLANIQNAPLQFRNFCLPKMKTMIQESTLPVYGIMLGDMTTDSKWYSSNYDLGNYLDEVRPLDIPLFHVIGNHDNDPYIVGDWDSASTFRKKIGPSYFSANIGKWHFLFVDDIIYRNASGGQGSVSGISDYSDGFSPEVLNWMRKDLADVGTSTPVCLCMHSSLMHQSAASRKDVMDMLSGFEKVMCLSGHHHHSEFWKASDNIQEHNVPSVTGVTWESFGTTGLHICHDGTPASFRVYDFISDDVSWKQYPYDYDEDYQFRPYDLNSIPSEYGGQTGSNAILVNVFGCDPSWKVEAVQGDVSLDVSAVTVSDPLYLKVYKLVYDGKTGGMYIPAKSAHMFRIKALDAISPVTITVTDQFGRTFSKTFERPENLEI